MTTTALFGVLVVFVLLAPSLVRRGHCRPDALDAVRALALPGSAGERFSVLPLAVAASWDSLEIEDDSDDLDEFCRILSSERRLPTPGTDGARDLSGRVGRTSPTAWRMYLVYCRLAC
jgi:hypothetical protein